MNQTQAKPDSDSAQSPSDEQLKSRVDAQGQWITATFVLAMIAIVLAALLMVQVNRVRSLVASQSQLIAELQKQKAMDDFLRSQLDDPKSADSHLSSDSEIPIE